MMKISLSAEAERFIQQQLSRGRFRSADEVIHTALALLKDQETETSADVSCYDLFQQAGLVGIVTDAPSDLSTNPRYMDGFGES